MFPSETHGFVESQTDSEVQLRTADQQIIVIPGQHFANAGDAVAVCPDQTLRLLTAQETAALDDLHLGYLEGREALRDMQLEAAH